MGTRLERLDLERIPGSMVLDLEAEEAVDRVERLRIGGGNQHAAACGSLHDGIRDESGQSLHLGHARRHAAVDEHRHLEVALLEGRGDVVEVLDDAAGLAVSLASLLSAEMYPPALV